MGGGTAKLLFVIEPGKPLKFGLRTADDLQIFNKLTAVPGYARTRTKIRVVYASNHF